MTESLQQRAERLVRQEVHYCVSSLVSTLAGGAYRTALRPDCEELAELTEQALELASPLLDYEEAAREAGWRYLGEFEFPWRPKDLGDEVFYDFQRTAEDVCLFLDIEPYEREVFEHWIVSDWLADKLAEKGEKVDKDFAGMTVWARTTTGQGIASDSVIESIAKDLLPHD